MKRKQVLIFLVLLTLSVGCDHATKQIALEVLDGSVTDFMSLDIGPVRTGIFNFADVSILAGVAPLFWTLRHRDDSEQQAT